MGLSEEGTLAATVSDGGGGYMSEEGTLAAKVSDWYACERVKHLNRMRVRESRQLMPASRQLMQASSLMRVTESSVLCVCACIRCVHALSSRASPCGKRGAWCVCVFVFVLKVCVCVEITTGFPKL